MRLAKSIYNEKGNLLLSAGLLLKQDYIGKLRKKGFASAYVGEIPSDIELPEVVSEKVRMQAMKAVRDSILSIKENGRLDRRRIMRAVDAILNELMQEKDLVISVLDLKSIGDYTFRHSVNVCILSLIIGRSMFFYKDQLRELGAGALLHDMGKSLVPEKILDKKGQLSKEEFEEVMKHPRYGYDLMAPFRSMSLLSRHIAYQHHERIDGSGYPRGLAGNQIIDYAKIVAVADCFDAMTSNRIYRNAMTAAEAIHEIAYKQRDAFDSKTIKVLLRSVAPYPVGIKVVLNTGDEAIVIKINPKSIERPVVTLLKNGSSNGNGGKRIDLLKDDSLGIVDSVTRSLN